MLPEPHVACPHGHLVCTLEQGAAQGMRCHVCGVTLERMDARWISGEVKRGGGTAIQLDHVVAELLLPAHNEVDRDAVGQFISSLPLPVSLELYGAGDRRVMLVRGPEGSLMYLAGKIQTLWPSACLRILEEDPVNARGTGRDDPHRYEFSFSLREAEYLPIRTWKSFLQGDPMHSLLATTLSLASTEGVWLQVLIARKGVPSWLARVQRRLKLEVQKGYTVTESDLGASRLPTFGQNPLPENLSWGRGLINIAILALAFMAVVLGFEGRWLLLVAFGVLGITVGGGALRYWGRKDDPWQGADLKLVQQKVVNEDAFFQVAVRASVWAATLAQARVLAERLESALAQYSVAGGNRFCRAHDPFEGMGPWPIQMASEERHWMWLGTGEVAGLWHPPIVNEEVSPGLLPVRGVEIRSPDPEDVVGFFQIGKYFTADGGSKPVRISSGAMQHNLFCIGKPGAGKSTLMLHLSLAGMHDEERPAVIVVDPHGDLVNQLMGAIDPEDASRMRILDVGDKEYTLAFNPLDVHREAWDVIGVTNSVVDIGRALWSEYWGPRMQNPLKRAVQLMVAANEHRPRDACLGLSQLASILNADSDVRKSFIVRELEGSEHLQTLGRYFLDDYDALSRNFREQVIQPVLSKAYRFEEEPMLTLFSCPESKLDVGQIVRDRNVLVINTGMNRYGSEVSDFVGSLMINVVLKELVRQGEKVPGHRVPVVIVIDEFQAFTGVAWAELIQQMRKYGGRMILGTQSLASLRKQDRNIPEIILSGVYSLFAFNMNGDDAEYISRLELSGDRGGPTADTLISLEPYKAYVRLERQDGGPSRPFYFESAPPPEFDELLAERVRGLRAGYSFRYEIAKEKAVAMLTYFDRYGASASVAGVGEGERSVMPGAPSSQAARVLLPGGKRNELEDKLAQVEMPWDVGLKAGRQPSEAEDAAKVVMGKEIDEEEWTGFLGAGGPPPDATIVPKDEEE